MKKKLLAILGSPQKNGSTAAMLSCASDAAIQAGWQITTIDLYQQQLAFCTGCCACVKTHHCCIQDDLQKLEGLLKECDVVVLAAPTYWANVPAPVKNLFDRLCNTVKEETKTFPKPLLSKNQKYLLLTACDTTFPFSRIYGQSSGALRSMEEFFHYAGMKRLGKISFDGAKGSRNLPKSVIQKIRRCLR